jgi:hypothetical protein
MEFTLCIGYHTDTAKPKELLYDELKLLLEMDVNLKDDLMYPKVKKFQLNLHS